MNSQRVKSQNKSLFYNWAQMVLLSTHVHLAPSKGLGKILIQNMLRTRAFENFGIISTDFPRALIPTSSTRSDFLITRALEEISGNSQRTLAYSKIDKKTAMLFYKTWWRARGHAKLPRRRICLVS